MVKVDWRALALAILITLAIASAPAAAQDCAALELQINDLESQLRLMQIESKAQYISLNSTLNKIREKEPEITRADLAVLGAEIMQDTHRQAAIERYTVPMFLAVVCAFSCGAALTWYWEGA